MHLRSRTIKKITSNNTGALVQFNEKPVVVFFCTKTLRCGWVFDKATRISC